jgi:two-component system, cell cycle sensor histidine kinase and response regulator CckA
MTGLEGGNRCILVVDDSPDIRRIVARALADARYAVLEADDGARALQILEREGVDIDLVLTDIKMPRVDGVELGRRIADRKWQVPVVYMSGGAGDGLVAPLLRKPFSMDTLMGILDRALLGGRVGQPAV